MNNIQDMPNPNNKWQLFGWLSSGKLQLNELWKNPLYRSKFLFRTLFSPITLKWLNQLSQYRLLGFFLSCQTNLPCKLLRPYLSSAFNKKSAFEALVYHYNFLASRSDLITKAFYNPDLPYLLSEITVKNDAKFQIAIQARNKYGREGELSLYFYDNEGIDLATLTFSIIEYQQKSTLFIGGLQGTGCIDAKARVQKATKECYGLFPKRMVIEASLILAEYFGIQQIVAVGNKTHVYNNWRYTSRSERVLSDYDDFWLTIDGRQDKNGFFSLPNKIHRKSIEEIASKKRSEYRNRYAVLDQLTANITDQLNKLN